MKKIATILMLIVLGGAGSFAQSGTSAFSSNDDAHWALGIKGGVGFNWASGPLGQPSNGLLMKGHAGVFAEYAFMKYLAIQSDFMIGLRHGFRRENYQLSWTTMDFDILIKGRLPVGSYVIFTAGVGLALSTGVGPLTETISGETQKVNFADYFLNAVGMGVVVELGVEYNLPKNAGYVGTSLRMDWKLNPHYKPLNYVDTERPKGSVHTPIGIMLFYGYRWAQPRLSIFG
ncbi:outer membrane beta-barrel protein [Entomospira culicis]|uniref:Porin family protein n=1 Tax=Entomospira culicis TaxID=2719989 RepID=A0A968KYS7_9SPIO|nr:outer membrane beta-barrel protein [Entomospira culicis]NIZ18400.1 porin family protein [Entomospira culicis]NIZ68616.1 porin family protein [Entomospira culicis]WDI37216.1 outer membrane beta-barrel protein [Entomospira culicis]WDI38844.1 outer membrane beta-barrel protein [Entomospira culicis]